MRVFVPLDYPKDKLVLVYQFENLKKQKFGEIMMAIIEVGNGMQGQDLNESVMFENFVNNQGNPQY